VKLDLDEIERKARAATQEGAWEVRVPDRGDGIQGVIVQTEDGRQIAEAYDSTPWSDAECIANGEHIAGMSPPVVLALVAIARKARAFVDEQGKNVSIERGYTIGLPEDFAAMKFDELVKALEGAGL
jgi:hypothetical protein